MNEEASSDFSKEFETICEAVYNHPYSTEREKGFALGWSSAMRWITDTLRIKEKLC